MRLTEAVQTGRDRDERDTAIYAVLGLTGPGGYARRDSDGHLTVWRTAEDHQNEDEDEPDCGNRCCYYSPEPISHDVWQIVCGLAWIEDYEEAHRVTAKGERWRPTHRIVFTPDSGASQEWVVFLADRCGPAYTRDEWTTETLADWERREDGWRILGKTTPDGRPGTVRVEPL